MVEVRSHSVSVSGIVVNELDQVLAIQRDDNGHWEAPGGVLELGETFEEGVRREVREETGIDVTVGNITGVYKNMTRGVVALVFRCYIAGGQPRPTDEARDVRWLSKRQLTELMTPAYAVRVLDALDGSATTRAHDGTNLLPCRNHGSGSSNYT